MELFQNILLMETQKAAQKEVSYTIEIINKVYGEWKKTGRRKNAVDLITTSANKLANINPAVLCHVHDAAKLKLVITLMRCMDLPPWKPIESKAKLYKKLFPLIHRLQNVMPNTGTGGSLRDIIMTRLSAAISYQDKKNSVFVAYEPTMPKKYLVHIFGQRELPEKTYRMQTLPLPDDFETLVEILTINHQKAVSKKNS